MGYKRLVQNQVKLAFKLIKDLADEVTLSTKNASDFNFDDQSVTETTAVTTIIKAVILKTIRKVTPEGKTTLHRKILCKSEDFDNPDIYDTVKFKDDTVWTIVPPNDDNGYTVTIECSKEA